ncbi:MAG: hypothetical protein JJE30_01100 [Desulfuromonadales bacterium]|nr:hypothetical protein [Desulfuromonadales bacterium]
MMFKKRTSPGLGAMLSACAALCAAATLGAATAFAAASVLNSPHNLSASGARGKHGVAFADETRVCIFCHAPHNANTSGPLWGRGALPDKAYKPYDSSTLKANPKPDKPTGASRLCLSCHDGTIALGQFVGSPILSSTTMPWDSNPTNNPNLSTDLSDDHPISFAYTEALATSQGELASPSALPYQVKLEQGTQLQCTSCHDPHNNEFGNFMVINNNASGSPLCIACHKNAGWPGSSHNPQNTPELASGCLNCHYVHNAPQPVRLLKSKKEEDTCLLNCHNSSGPAQQNVKPLFDSSRHRHPMDATTGVHDEKELLPAQNYHVQCVDCHNPHRAYRPGTPLSNPPAINGSLVGVRKDSTANATREYEICFKCHAGGNANKFSGFTESPPNRVIQEPDQMKRFDGMNPSFHPVVAQRRTNGSSLITALQSTMLMVYCSDCHNSDESIKAGGSGPSGPHGSRYEHILMFRYDMPLAQAPRSSYSASLYDLCFRCHAESFIMGSSSGFVASGASEHATHVRDRGVPCFACHDPHGVSSLSLPPGTPQNNAHLINFNVDYAANSSVPSPFYQTLSSRSGSCTVSCHSVGGATHSYAP